ncbi:YidH family protein [Nocardioides humi]|uniref:DUF202 domain-containing protein n=1 Tax=Nocardioides humi TaxID=449461 RepID=A0ABN2ATF5_9ACTN|nr:DUF202 domain-containing protein [Nocardioides humi]
MTARRPRSVYDVGDEPDPRFTFANERTFLAWIRTALALMAAGVALDSLASALPETPRRWLAAALVLAGVAGCVLAWLRWTANERALRESRPLPGLPAALVLAALVASGGLALVVLTLAVR